jgi:protocatechuate 3,4-dioxygenase beta subunit
VEVTTGSGGGDCGYAFREGAEYVVYARSEGSGSPLTVSICSRTSELSRAASDLDYARAVKSGAPLQARISGDVVFGARSLSRGPLPEPKPLSDVPIRLEREGQVTRVATGADGSFSAEGLKAGRYWVHADLQEGLYAQGPPQVVDLSDDRSCGEAHFLAFADGRVSGRVVDAMGRPIPGLTIELTVAAGLDETPGPERLRALTDGDGRYEIERIPPGRFIIAINTERNRNGALLQPRVFYPGVTALSGARGVSLKSGERVQLRDFMLPRDLTVIAVSGIVLDAAGLPAPNAQVYLKGEAGDDYILGEPAVTDPNGRFTLATIAGRNYRLFAERSRDEASRIRIDSSEQVPFTATASGPPFKLTLRARY